MRTALADLACMSARVGADRMLTQGPGGNTSLKVADRMWVKGSGLWLREACEHQIFVPLWLPDVLQIIVSPQDDDFSLCVIAEGAGGPLRPSIETALHALMPHTAVIHAHAVNCMTMSVLDDGLARVAERLNGLVGWCWIPYRRPGRALATCIQEHAAGEVYDVMILQNHGVLVGADTPDKAEDLLRFVEGRVSLPARGLPAVDIRYLSAHETDEYRICFEVSGAALDDFVLDVLTAAPLIPDQVVFLGGALPVVAPGETADDTSRRVSAMSGVVPAFIAVRGLGLLGRQDRSVAAEPLLEALIEMARRVPEKASVSGLPAHAVAELLGWEAERYRQAVNRAGLSNE